MQQAPPRLHQLVPALVGWLETHLPPNPHALTTWPASLDLLQTLLKSIKEHKHHPLSFGSYEEALDLGWILVKALSSQPLSAMRPQMVKLLYYMLLTHKEREYTQENGIQAIEAFDEQLHSVGAIQALAQVLREGS